MTRWLAIALALIASTGCDAWLTKPSRYNTVTVLTTRRDGSPVPGAGVVLYTGARPMGYGATDSTGRFVFTRVPQGLYGVNASPPAGYGLINDFIGGPPANIIGDVQVAADSVAPLHFTFLKQGSGTLSVQVTAAGGGPLSGVGVDLYDPTKVDAHAVTDSNGVAVFRDASYGVHGIRVIRPTLYKDFIHVDDSVYSVRENLIVDQGSSQSLVVPITKCAGTVRATVVDQTGAPVPLTTAVLFTSVSSLQVTHTGADGSVTFADAPCAWQLAVAINPPLGYTVGQGRGLNVLDGLQVTNGAVTSIRFVVQKQ